MVKKFKAIGENQLAQTVKDSAQQIWLAGLGAFAKAQEEGTKVFDALVKEGESIQNKTRKVADEQIAVVTGKAVGTWDRLEQVFEDRVARALSSLGVPSKKDIDKLSKRVAELTSVVQKLTEAQEAAEKAVAKSAAKAVAKPAASKPAPVATKTAAPKAAEPKAAAPKAAVRRRAAPKSEAAKPAATATVAATAS
ncbi:MAG: phasin family protein [Betaproteobacteria bacterium]|nr:phasin family protein [Betaproteobacteria bacterium]